MEKKYSVNLGKFSIGMGDRFGHQGKAQLQAIIKAQDLGVHITPVWNKSYREHDIIGTHPRDVRREADEAVSRMGWHSPYFVDADHVGLKTVDRFLESSDFFTIDVAEFIGQSADEYEIESFVQQNQKYVGELILPGIEERILIQEQTIEGIAREFLCAVQEAGRIYRHVLERKEGQPFVVEVSMDETDTPQTPVELFFILAAIAQEKIPAQTIAPKFTGRFNKGVDYVGDIDQFTKEFKQDLAVLTFAVQEFSLSQGLKLSVHSGSDKFSIYRPIGAALKEFDAGLHLKTAGTTWLEEIVGLAEAGGSGLAIAKEIYRNAFSRSDELCRPYRTVIDIEADRLPDPDVVETWDSDMFVAALRHDPQNSAYNSDLRQLLHVGYKVAAEMDARYPNALVAHEAIVAKNVSDNLFERHIKRLFL